MYTKLPLGKGMAYIDIAPGTTVQFGVDPKCGMDLKPHLMLSLVNDGEASPWGVSRTCRALPTRWSFRP